MSEDAKYVIRMALETEIRAFEADISRDDKALRRDYWGNRLLDVREEHLKKLRLALAELERAK